MNERIFRQLDRVDWDFISGDEKNASGLHWYPGTFVPGLPGALIEALTKPGEIVFDPYCGAGTTGVAALLRQREPYITDVNPIALASSYCSLALTSLHILDGQRFNALFGAIDALVTKHEGASLEFSTASLAADLQSTLNAVSLTNPFSDFGIDWSLEPNIDALSQWFDQSTLASIELILRNAKSIFGDTILYLLAFVMVSAVARQLSSQTQSWGHIADNVRPKSFTYKDVVRASLNWSKRTRSRLNRLHAYNPRAALRFTVDKADWLGEGATEPANKASLLVTSPPYAGAIDYTLAQRLSLYLLGADDTKLAQLVDREMGARRKRLKHAHVTSWADQIASAARQQMAYVRPNGYAAYIMPHKDSGRELGEEALNAAFSEQGWTLAFKKDRSIRQARTRQSWTSIKRETIFVFHNSGG
jgi:hypothetical protein